MYTFTDAEIEAAIEFIDASWLPAADAPEAKSLPCAAGVSGEDVVIRH